MIIQEVANTGNQAYLKPPSPTKHSNKSPPKQSSDKKLESQDKRPAVNSPVKEKELKVEKIEEVFKDTAEKDLRKDKTIEKSA